MGKLSPQILSHRDFLGIYLIYLAVVPRKILFGLKNSHRPPPLSIQRRFYFKIGADLTI